MSVPNIETKAGRHVALIMDGNGRCATREDKPRLMGHMKGAAGVDPLVTYAPKAGIKFMTLYAFSTENWKRDRPEVDGLMTLFGQYINDKLPKFISENVRVRFIGDRTDGRLPMELLYRMHDAEQQTALNSGLQLTVAINYSHQADVDQANRELWADIKLGSVGPDDVNASRYLWAGFLPEVDLMVRTGCEGDGKNFRHSGFLVGHIGANTVCRASDVLFPDYGPKDLAADLRAAKLGTYLNGAQRPEEVVKVLRVSNLVIL